MKLHSGLAHVGTAAVVIGALSAGVTAPEAPSAHATSTLAPSRATAWSTTEVLEGLLFMQGSFGEELLRSGALGPLSAEQSSALKKALAEPRAAAIARSVVSELEQRLPAQTAALMKSLRASDPIGVQAAMSELGAELPSTPTLQSLTAHAPATSLTYVPGEIGTDCGVLVWVVAGAVLVVTVAAVGVGVLALASTVAVGSTKVAGKNAIRRATGSTGQALEDLLTANAIDTFRAR
jgi:SdpC family antimicrobial peptide